MVERHRCIQLLKDHLPWHRSEARRTAARLIEHVSRELDRWAVRHPEDTILMLYERTHRGEIILHTDLLRLVSPRVGRRFRELDRRTRQAVLRIIVNDFLAHHPEWRRYKHVECWSASKCADLFGIKKEIPRIGIIEHIRTWLRGEDVFSTSAYPATEA